jgi:hypothetical protein
VITPQYLSKISRRTTLQWFAAAVAASSAHRYASAMQKSASPPPVKGYGTDPDLNHPTIPWARTMTSHQLQVAAVIADIILPASGSAPAPSAIGVPDFVDEWISAPYPEQQADRTIFLAGFEWLESEAGRRWSRGFMEVEISLQEQLLQVLIPKDKITATPAWAILDQQHNSQDLSDRDPATRVRERFFSRFRYVVVGAYYTTSEGFKDIGYVGNVPLQSYPPVTEKERAILDEELSKLGIHS